MRGRRNRGLAQTWSIAWIVLVRLLLYLVIVAFFLQHIYFAEDRRIARPSESITLLVVACAFNLLLVLFGSEIKRFNLLIILSHILDVAVLTRVILLSGGFHSVLVPYYLPVLVIAPAWLPRRFTALFPSMATLGVAYIGAAHLLMQLRDYSIFIKYYPAGLLAVLRDIPAPTIVSNMLILTVLFFVISYLAGFLSHKIFLEQRLNQEILASMKEGVAVVDSKRNLFFANGEFLRLFPAAKEDATFPSVLATIFPEDGGELPFDVLTGDDASESLVITREPNEKTGTPPLEIRVSALSIRGEQNLFGVILLVSDLSLRRRMERVERELAHFSSITTMAAGLAHEIRNPLASLRSAMQEIGEAFPRDSQNRTLTDIVISESDRLDGVIGRFLDFSRESELRLSRQRLGPLLDDTRILVTRDRSPDELRVTVDAGSNPEMLCDPDRLREVFLNLALNAAQAVPEKGGRIDIALRERASDGLPGVEILFMDNGPGMAEDVMKRMFDPFFTRREGGTGMGLPLSRKQVSMHGGEIRAENREGGGACITVWLPLSAAMPRRSGDTRRYSRRLNT